MTIKRRLKLTLDCVLRREPHTRRILKHNLLQSWRWIFMRGLFWHLIMPVTIKFVISCEPLQEANKSNMKIFIWVHPQITWSLTGNEGRGLGGRRRKWGLEEMFVLTCGDMLTSRVADEPNSNVHLFKVPIKIKLPLFPTFQISIPRLLMKLSAPSTSLRQLKKWESSKLNWNQFSRFNQHRKSSVSIFCRGLSLSHQFAVWLRQPWNNNGLMNFLIFRFASHAYWLFSQSVVYTRNV